MAPGTSHSTVSAAAPTSDRIQFSHRPLVGRIRSLASRSPVDICREISQRRVASDVDRELCGQIPLSAGRVFSIESCKVFVHGIGGLRRVDPRWCATPVAAHGVDEPFDPAGKAKSTIASCFCEFLPGIGAEPTQLVSCETQTHVTELASQFVQTSASEQGSIQLADDGWTETQKQIDEIRTFIFSLLSVGHCGREEHAEKVGDLQSFYEQHFHEQDLMQFT